MANSFFKKKEDHLVTFKSNSCKTQIDYFLKRKETRRSCKDCKFSSSELLGTQHRLLVLDAEFKYPKRSQRRTEEPRIKWWTLTKEKAGLIAERLAEERVWRRAKDADSMWDVVADCIRRSAKETLGLSRGGGNRMEGAWWWNEEVKKKVKAKKEAYAEFMSSSSEDEREDKKIGYKVAKKVAKRAVTVAKSQAFDRLYHKLGTKEGENEVFKLARARERKTRDLGVVSCIKDEEDKVLTEDAEIKERWQRFFLNSSMGRGETTIVGAESVAFSARAT